MIEPTEPQLEAILDAITTTRNVTRIHGYAGSGKTAAVAAQVVRQLEAEGVTVQVLAPTGKAARVLRRKGLHSAATVHSWLYTPSKRERQEWRAAWGELAGRLLERDPASAALVYEIDAATSETELDEVWAALGERAPKKLAERVKAAARAQRFALTFTASGAITHYEDTGMPAADVLLVDESSMVSENMAADLMRCGSRLIFIGDPAQLPPVGARPSREAMGPPHHLLTEVHRQKGGSPVLKLATRIRTSDEPSVEPTKPKHLLRLEDYDQVLCWRNATREQVNAEVRRRLRRKTAAEPEPGDKLVCIKNTKPEADGERRWMNGEQVTVLGVLSRSDEWARLAIRDDEGVEHEVDTDASTLAGHAAERRYLDHTWGGPTPAFAFGYGLTVHKSQGSEWPRVLIIDETSGMRSVATRSDGPRKALEQVRSWLYTGTTRASEAVHIVRNLRDVP